MDNAINKINLRLPGLLLFLVILIEGFVSVAVEILVIRQLMPMVGTSVIVTSFIIGIFLLFLAIGYWRGGEHCHNFYGILKRNFLLAAILVGVGLSSIFIANFFAAFAWLTFSLLVVLVLYLLLIIAPLVYFLGQTIPITMNLVKSDRLVGNIGGKVLFLSTVGSFFGAILTTVLLMEFLGVAWTVMINFGLILLLTWFLSKETALNFVNVVISVAVILLVYQLNIGYEKNVLIATNSYADYKVIKNIEIEQKVGDVLQINNSFSSFIDVNRQGFPYIEELKRILFEDLKFRNKEILVLGAGGFSLSAAGTHGNHFTYVDIDPKIKTIVEKHFQSPIKGDFVAADARTYLNQINQRYDVIISDCYSNIETIPAQLLTVEHLRNIKRALSEHGIAIFNIIARPFLADNYSKRVDNTIRLVFKNCAVIPLYYNSHPSNILYVCSQAANENDRSVYTDDKNTISSDYFGAK